MSKPTIETYANRVHGGKVALTPRNTPSRRVLKAQEYTTLADGRRVPESIANKTQNPRRYIRTLHATKGFRTERVAF